MAQMQPNPFLGPQQPMAPMGAPMGGMNNMLLPLLLLGGDNGGGLGDNLLPLALMGGMGGQPGQAGGMMSNPLMMLALLGDGGLGGSGSNDMLLPLMMMGGMGGDPNSMNSLLPLLLLGDDGYTPKTDAELTVICNGIVDLAENSACNQLKTDYLTAVAACTAMTDEAAKTTCLAATKTQELAILAKAGQTPSNSNDLLMLMMMGGGMGGGAAGGMNSMLPLLLLDGGLGGSGGMSDMLLPLMLMGQPQIDPQTGQPMAGGMGGMDPLMMMLLLGDN